MAASVLAGTMLASAADPALPKLTPAQLLAAMHRAKPPAALTATVSQSANLGFPALPDIGGMDSSPLSPAALISGTHTIQIWYGGPGRLRIALLVSFGETDMRINRTQAWLWESQGQRATKFILPRPRGIAVPAEPAQRAPVPMTPIQAADRFLRLIGPTTKVTIPGTATVAGRSAYQLAIAPRSGQSLIGRIEIAVDAQTHLPLSLQVFARGASSPAFAIGFTSLSFTKPAASNFTFTPPPGAKVKTVHVPAGHPGVMPGHHLKLMPRHGRLRHPDHGPPPWLAPVAAGPRTFGTGWLTVVAVPFGAAIGGIVPGGSGAYHSSLRISGPAAQGLGLLKVLLKASKPVHGAWGSGHLLRTSLLSVLLTSKGEILAGAVTPAVLFADAAKVK
ncbi:MAG TPA: DUF2092 domain-containing protein [Streptosporangiaceae bacterium]|nr:DUF2092 domain-containing protein [Streptosporangiaceae bacterium]